MRSGRGPGYETAQVVTCMQCGANVAPAERFCESCGAALSAIRRVAVPRPAPSATVAHPCADCGDGTYVDEYCTVCGNRRAEPDRDEAELDGIVLITDRGLEHPRNEDAGAAGIVAGGVGEQPPRSPLSCATGSPPRQSPTWRPRAASMAGVDAMLNALAAHRDVTSVDAGRPDRCGEGSGGSQVARRLDPTIAPSCTYTRGGRRSDLGRTRCRSPSATSGTAGSTGFPNRPRTRNASQSTIPSRRN